MYKSAPNQLQTLSSSKASTFAFFISIANKSYLHWMNYSYLLAVFTICLSKKSHT